MTTSLLRTAKRLDSARPQANSEAEELALRAADLPFVRPEGYSRSYGANEIGDPVIAQRLMNSFRSDGSGSPKFVGHQPFLAIE